MSKFLEQTGIVQALINNAVKSLNYVSDDGIKKALIESLEPFYSAVAPTAIYVEEIELLAMADNVQLSHGQALDILENITYDIDLNYANDSIKFHVNEFVLNN